MAVRSCYKVVACTKVGDTGILALCDTLRCCIDRVLDNNDGIERAALDALLPSPEDIMLEQEEQRLKQLKLQRMKQAIAGLPIKQAKRLQMHYLNSMTYKVLAEVEGVSGGAIFHSVQDAMRNIRLQFQKNHWMEDL